MARLSDMKRRFSESAEAADALGTLTEFGTIITIGTTASGGALTIPLLFVHSSKAAGALLKLGKLLLIGESEQLTRSHPAERADDIFYVFAQRAYLSALSTIEEKVPKRGKLDKSKHQKLIESLQVAVVKPELAEASFQFGWTPASGPLPLFVSYTSWISALLISMGMAEPQVRKLTGEVEIQARKNLHKELVNKGEDRAWMVHYQLLENTASILDLLHDYSRYSSSSADAAWTVYLADVANRPTLPIWGEEEHGLSINKLFIEPSYTYEKYTTAGACVAGSPADSVPLKAFLTGLLSGRRPSSELVFVMGGPGTGKTSLMEVLCGELANSGAVPIVLVPAKRLDPSKALFVTVQNYLINNGHASIAESIALTDDCVIAIDGFDELAHATLSSLESFFREAQELVRERNSTRLRIILSGRPTLFSANDVAIPSGSHVVTLEPFDADRVARWSERWRLATGGSFEGSVYQKSQSSDIRELATQPMLLYLLAKMHEEGEPIPHEARESGGGRFRVYAHILDWVCRRQEDKSIPTTLSAKLRRFLQVAGLATHQSGQRTLHWRHFARSLEHAGLIGDPQEVDAKVHSTILSFAFTSLEQRAWEFTHKSFGEALAAEAIGRVLEDISEIGRDGEPWRLPLNGATTAWIQTFGPHFLTKDVLDFCKGWLQLKDTSFLKALVFRMVEILHHLLSQSASEALARAANERERPVQNVLGNAIRSWFALANSSLEQLRSLTPSSPFVDWKNAIQLEQFRIGVYMSNLVSPISVGEASTLFRYTSHLVAGRELKPSRQYRQMLLEATVLIRQEPMLLGYKEAESVQRGLFASRQFLNEAKHMVFSAPNERYREYLVDRGMWAEFRPMEALEAAPLESALSQLEALLLHGYENSPVYDITQESPILVKSAADLRKFARALEDRALEIERGHIPRLLREG